MGISVTVVRWGNSSMRDVEKDREEEEEMVSELSLR